MRLLRFARLAAGSSMAALAALPSLTRPLAAQQRWDYTSVQPQFGLYHEPALRGQGENRWGWVAGVRFGFPLAHRLHAFGTLSFLRTANFRRDVGSRGTAVFASETMLPTIGIGYDLIARQTTRVTLSAEAGPAWERRVETDRVGSRPPGLVASTGFSFGGAAVTTLDVRHTITRGIALDSFLRSYIGGGGVAPAFGVGLDFPVP